MGISVIVPHYNSADLLIRLVHSIEINKNIEIIVVDDYSDLEEIKKIEDSNIINRVKFIKNTEAKGAGTCRNIGMRYITKNWVLFADADDFFIEHLEKLELKKYEKYDVIYFPPQSCYSDTLKKATRHIEFTDLIKRYNQNRTKVFLDELKYHWVVPWSKLIKVEIIKKNMIYFDECIAGNDVMFSIKLAEKTEKLKIENFEIYCVTVNKGSLTLNQSIENFLSRFEVLKRKNNFYKNKKMFSYVTPGLSFLIQSRKYGIKIFLMVIIYVLRNIKFLFNGKKNWKRLLKEKIILSTQDKKYIVRKTNY